MPLNFAYYWNLVLHSPWSLVPLALHVWLLIDAARREEWLWAGFMLFFPGLADVIYFFYVMRAAPSATVGFELPGARNRRRIKELQAQIHNLDKPHHYLELGDIYFQKGDLKRAEECYRACLERDAQDIDARAHLGQCLLRAQNAAAARPLLEQVCREKPMHDYGYSLMALAETLAALGEQEAAASVWQQVLESHNYARARVQLAEIHLAKNRPDLAQAGLREVIADDAHAPNFQRKRDRVWIRRARRLLRASLRAALHSAVRSASCFGFLGGLLLLALLTGCASPSPRVRYLVEIEPSSLTNLVAYRTDTNLEIRIPLRGKDAYAHAGWPRTKAGATNYQGRFAVLTFEKESPRARRAAVTRNNQVAIRDAQQWKQLVQAVFSGVAPAAPEHGVLLLVENEEIVIFRDITGNVGEVKLENKPPEIVVDHTYDDMDFSRLAIRLLEAGATILPGGQSQFLFVTGERPAFVFMDLRQRLLVFLDYPGDPETPEQPAVFAMRALNSLLVRSLLVAAVKNPFTLLSRGFWHIGMSGAAAITTAPDSPGGPPPPLATGPGMDLAAWEKELDKLVSARRYQGKVELLIDGAKFFPALIGSVQGAARSVDAQVYIFDNDEYAVKIANLLKRRSQEVRVRVLMDDAGSLFAGNVARATPARADFQRPADIQAYLRAGSRVEVRATANPWLTMDHRKCFIIDDRQAFLGGMNIGREYRYEWHDMMVGLTGPVVGRLEKAYDKAWVHAGWLGDFAYAWVSLFEPAAPRNGQMPGGIDIRPLRTATFKSEIYVAQMEAINRAKSYIYIENAYFDDNTVLRALIQARRRGVDVRVIFPAENDSGIMQTSDAINGNALLGSGARVYVYPGMTHVKAAIYDGWACLGSANFNKMSLRVGQELDVAFSDPATVDRLKRELFETDFQRSRELTQPVPLNWYDSFVKAFANEL